MHPEIQTRFNALEERRKKLVQRVRALPKDKQNLKKDPRTFSAVEMLMHMALAEQGNIEFLKKNPPETLKGKKTKMTFIFRKTLSLMEQPTKPIATVGAMVPKEKVSLDDAARAWKEVREETAAYLEKVESPDDPFIKFLFYFGLGSANDYFALLEAHTTYHEQRFPA